MPIPGAQKAHPVFLSRVPPPLRHFVLSRGEWISCALERSCFGPMHDPTPAVPFHHLAVRLDRAPMKMGWAAEGREHRTNLPKDHVSIIPAGASVTSWWSRPVDFACLYFTPQAIEAAVGEEVAASSHWELKLVLAAQAPTLSGIIRALASDAHKGQPYGAMLGEALFQQLAELLIADERLVTNRRYKATVGDWRVRRALDYMHAHFAEPLNLQQIAAAAETSPFHLSRSFRQSTGCSIWQYVSRLRLRVATGLMKDTKLTLTEIAALSGFTSYSTFASNFVAQNHLSPHSFRRVLGLRQHRP